MTNTPATTPIIAIDGPAASGKGTLARTIAEKLNYAHMDTGALYRAAAWEILQTSKDPANETDAIEAAHLLNKKIQGASAPSEILQNPALREEVVGKAASQISSVQQVRDILLGMQRDFAANPGSGFQGAVLDGRDIGTVICPQATVKLFITATTEIRAKRRLKELQSKGIAATYGAVLSDMQARDERDASRQVAPMKPAKDAIVIDTSDQNAQQVLEKALEIIKSKLPA